MNNWDSNIVCLNDLLDVLINLVSLSWLKPYRGVSEQLIALLIDLLISEASLHDPLLSDSLILFSYNRLSLIVLFDEHLLFMVCVIRDLLAASLVLLVPLDTLVVYVGLLAASVRHLLLGLREETLELLVHTFSFQLVLSLDFKSHLKLQVGLLLVGLELSELELSTLLEVLANIHKLTFKLDGLSLHIILGIVKVSDAPLIFSLDLSSVGRHLLSLLLLILIGLKIPLLPGVLALKPPFSICVDSNLLFIEKLLENWVSSCKRGDFSHLHMEAFRLL